MNYLKYYGIGMIIVSAQGIIHATSCDELKAHEDYWKVMEGGVDLDPAKGNRLRAECDAENPCYQLQRHDLYWSKKGADLDPARRAYLEEKCTPGAAAARAVAASAAQEAQRNAAAVEAAKNELVKHIDYWTKNGRTDSTGRRYDGDANRGRGLLEDLRKLNPGAAAEFAPRMLPDPICADLAEHTAYWLKNGILKDEKAYDLDYSGKGQRLLTECKKYSPGFAAILEKEMLPLGAVEEYKEHIDYWIEKGEVDLDPAKTDRLYKAAYAVNPQQADAIKARAPKNVFEHTDQFLKDLTEGRIPVAFKLKGKLSDPISKIPPMLDATAKAVQEIPKGFILMYTELGTKKYDLRSAIDGIIAGKKTLDESSKETEANPLVPQDLKDDLMQGFEATAKTLPEIENILSELYSIIDTLVPTTAPQQSESIQQFESTVKNAAITKTNQEIQPFVSAVTESLNRQYEGRNLAQALTVLGNDLNVKNL